MLTCGEEMNKLQVYDKKKYFMANSNWKNIYKGAKKIFSRKTDQKSFTFIQYLYIYKRLVYTINMNNKSINQSISKDCYLGKAEISIIADYNLVTKSTQTFSTLRLLWIARDFTTSFSRFQENWLSRKWLP